MSFFDKSQTRKKRMRKKKTKTTAKKQMTMMMTTRPTTATRSDRALSSVKLGQPHCLWACDECSKSMRVLWQTGVRDVRQHPLRSCKRNRAHQLSKRRHKWEHNRRLVISRFGRN